MLERHTLEEFRVTAQQGFVLLAGITPTIINEVIFILPEIIVEQLQPPDSDVMGMFEKLLQPPGGDAEQVRVFHHSIL